MRSQTSLSLFSAFLLFPLSTLALAVSSGFTGEVKVGDVEFDLKELKQHSVVVEKHGSPATIKRTYTINPLGKIELDKAIDAKEQCPDGTQVCSISRAWHDDKPDEHVLIVIAHANAEASKDSGPEYGIMKDSDGKVLGLNVTLQGPKGGEKDLAQKTIINFLCDKDKTGLEEPDKDGKGDNSLKFVSYEGDEVLTLEWKTQWACAGAHGEIPVESKGSWGFFTWFIVIVFLVVAAYLIFGSWLNYNKYGARGYVKLPV